MIINRKKSQKSIGMEEIQDFLTFLYETINLTHHKPNPISKLFTTILGFYQLIHHAQKRIDITVLLIQQDGLTI